MAQQDRIMRSFFMGCKGSIVKEAFTFSIN
jgi:hypothetical protein